MRNHALLEAAAHELPPSNVGRIKAQWRNWMARRDIRRLADLDDWILKDIGVTRAEIDWATRLPLDLDPAKALERHARIRRESQF